MKKLCIIILSCAILSACTKEQLASLISSPSLSNQEIVEGLKNALQVGTDTSVVTLNKLDGYYRDEAVKILLPAEAQVIYDNINRIPGNLGTQLLEQAIVSINRAAEDAAIEAKPIFIDAITGITISDGLSILNGKDTAATAYLKLKTFTPLTNAFAPKINTSLGKPLVGNISAASAYTDLVNAYNTASLGGVLFPRITTNTLGEHVTQKALDGLFLKVAEEEKAIRTDPLARVTDILKKVFGK
ncbi:MAG: DUF4197 domain-containing protein [Bacteroidia bacterium]|jgi:hypothetical protein|nr:DUF4197 domain-containing protein [Bacteroidia bacterium]